MKFFSVKLYFVLRMVLAAVFLYSGVAKLTAPSDFAVIISGYGILPDFIVPSAAVAIPLLEVFVAVGLCFDVKGTLTAYSVIMIVFVAVLFHGIRMGLDVDCGCFGPDDPEGKAFHSLREALWRDGVILVGCLYLYAVRMVRGVAPVSVRKTFSWLKQ